MPEARSLPHDVLFVVGCDRQAEGKWYRGLRADGKPVLKGWSPASGLEQTASGPVGGSTFAVAIVSANKPLPPQAFFHTADLHDEQIALYRTENGARLLSIRISNPVPTVQSFAVSPEGNQIAVLQESQIQLYSVASH